MNEQFPSNERFPSAEVKPTSPKPRATPLARAALRVVASATILAIGGDHKPPPAPTAPAAESALPKNQPEKRRGLMQELASHEAEFFTPHPHGDFTPEEKHARSIHLPNGEHIFQDVGVSFYVVARGDTTVEKIRARLARYPRYAYLKTQTMKLQSFNIPNRSLQPGMRIPIPFENIDRHLTDEEFCDEARHALHEMMTHPIYGPTVRAILKTHGMNEDKFVASLLAIAKQESGGEPLGQFEFHRWEGRYGHHEFSFSLFHVIMSGPGVHARKRLNMTEGQTYHPRNAVKLCVAFLIEKAHETNCQIAHFFPFTKKTMTQFATFYNGAGWRAHNPQYLPHLIKFYDEACNEINGMEKNSTTADTKF